MHNSNNCIFKRSSIYYLIVGGVSDNEESLAAKKTKQMIARTYGKRNRKKSKLKPAVYGTVWDHGNSSDTSASESHNANHLLQFKVCLQC